MCVERAPGGTSLIDVLDRVLDKGIVIDAWVRASLVGIDLSTVEARIVVASIDTWLKYFEGTDPGCLADRSAEMARSRQQVLEDNAAIRALRATSGRRKRAKSGA